MEGFVVQGGYALSDAITFNVTYGNGSAADKSLGTGGAGDIGINPLDRYQIFQADLTLNSKTKQPLTRNDTLPLT
jgi:hypothetical protein